MFDSPIQEIKDKLSILDVVQDFVQLKKAGTNYKGLCPFHSEKTGSFMVSPSKQIWHCFGCGLGGDIFEFIKQIENVDFPEALKILADRAGVELKKPTAEQIQAGEKKEVLYDINDQAAKYFAKVLWESNAGAEALAYLKKRGLSDQTIKNWQLGYAPADFHYLENFLAKTFDKRDIEQAGLIIKSDKGGYFDRFHDRVMFPITNLHGQVVGFTGRLLHDQPNTGKYVNSPETPIYNKSQIIYGLYQAKNQIRKLNRAIIVEGNMDVIACHQVGFNEAVAVSGTAFTEQQLNILKRFTENLIFALDSDTAGFNAIKKGALDLALAAGLNVRVADLGEAKDPDELIKKGIGLWEKALDRAGLFTDFFFDKILTKFDPATVDGKREIAKELAPLIYRMNDPITKAHYVRKLAHKINVAENAIWGIIKTLSLPKPTRQQAVANKQKGRKDVLTDQVLGLTLITGNQQFLDVLGLALPTEPAQRELLVFSAEMDTKEQGLDPKVELPKIAGELKRLIIHDRMLALGQEIAAAEAARDKTLIDKLSQEYVTLSKQMSQ